MELPVIVTNFSGPTAYLTDDNAFPLSFTLGDGDFAEVWKGGGGVEGWTGMEGGIDRDSSQSCIYRYDVAAPFFAMIWDWEHDQCNTYKS